MGKHLPGPWFLEWDKDCESFQIYDAQPDENDEVFMTIATVHVGERPSSQAHQPANARLIAAAPELLAALRLGMQWSEDDGYPDDDATLSVGERLFRQAARAAIAKAEGRDE
jgi:hypothetical protein